jgi:MFS family permease
MLAGNRRTLAAATIALALIIGTLLGLAGFLAGGYLREHLGSLQTDPDEMASYGWGMLVGGVSAITGFASCMFLFWPCKKTPAQETSTGIN